MYELFTLAILVIILIYLRQLVEVDQKYLNLKYKTVKT